MSNTLMILVKPEKPGATMPGMDAQLTASDRTADQAAQKVLKGNPAAFGQAVGPAVVVGNAFALSNIPDKAILVCKHPKRELMVLFPIAAGLITESGGLLSSTVACAREHGLPVVVGVPEATKIIQSGDFVRIDGEQGRVEVLG